MRILLTVSRSLAYWRATPSLSLKRKLSKFIVLRYRVEDRNSVRATFFRKPPLRSPLEDYSLLGDLLPSEEIPDPPIDRIAWIDGYGNLKTTIPSYSIELEPLSKVVVRVGDIVSDAVYSDGSFKVPEGTLAFAPGSSGWLLKDGKKVRWMELFLRGGNAWERFGRPKVNHPVTYTH